MGLLLHADGVRREAGPALSARIRVHMFVYVLEEVVFIMLLYLLNQRFGMVPSFSFNNDF